MNFSKLKLDRFQTYNGFQLPEGFDPPLQYSEEADVLFVFCDTFEQLNRYTNQLLNQALPTENRVFYIYKKGNKQFHRDHVLTFIEGAPFLKKKLPIISKLDDTYTCLATMMIAWR